MKRITLITSLTFTLFLSACGEQPSPKTYTVSCRSQVLHDIPDNAQPQCDEITFMNAVNFWNDAAKKDSIGAIFDYVKDQEGADIRVISDLTSPGDDRVWLPIVKKQDPYYLAHQLGKAIKLPNNPNPVSIMNESYDAQDPKSLEVTPEDLDAYLDL